MFNKGIKFYSKKMSVKLAVVGATGLVGTKVLEILAERNYPVETLILTASERSIGKEIAYKGTKYAVVSMQDAVDAKPDIAIFSAGGDTSLEWAPKFAEMGTIVVDNSSAWRMNPKNKLIVPEINADTLSSEDKIIANPNCSTIQMVLALAPLHKAYRIKRVVVSTYQSVTGTGKAAVDQLYGERNNTKHEKVYPHTLDMNVLPHVDVFQENGYTKEEMKMVNETKKILGDESIQLTATCVRLPVTGGHSEAVNVQFENPFELKEVREILSNTDGIIIEDNPANNEYPMPLNAHDKDEVFVGRLRKDESQPNTLDMWIVSDNLRKGAATNAIQIAEYISEHILVY
ncbi:MAG: aspartate-semialdehyde dehydrogenase [Parvicellaceae bacterium]